MTEITGLTTQPPQNAGLAQQSVSEAQAQTVSDFNDFLTLLTAQLRNQDPLSPLDSTKFVEQLASFSQVEQAVATNDKLDTLLSQITSSELSDLAVWVGRDVQATGLDFSFDGESLTVDAPVEPGATAASVVIRDQDGREVATLAAPVEGGPVTWDGTKADGGAAPAGVYQIEFVYGIGQPGAPDAETVTRQADGAGRVKEVRIENGLPVLVLDDGARVSPGEVTAVIDADAA